MRKIKPTNRQLDRAVTKLIKMEAKKRHRYTYFIERAGTGYRWVLVDAAGNDISMSDPFVDKTDCLKSLRANQRHASTPDVRDDTR